MPFLRKPCLNPKESTSEIFLECSNRIGYLHGIPRRIPNMRSESLREIYSFRIWIIHMFWLRKLVLAGSQGYEVPEDSDFEKQSNGDSCCMLMCILR